MTNKKFFYYYTEKDYKENKQPLGYFEMKHLYKLEILPDFSIGSKKNIFSITVSQWMKKDIPIKGRTFYLSTDSKEKLTEWVTLINFLRVKSTYDEFSNVYGLINLPLSHENPGKRKKIKNKLNSDMLLNTVFPVKGTSSFYNSIARRSIMNFSSNVESESKIVKVQKKNRRGSFLPKNSSERILEDMDNQMKIKKSKDNLIVSFSLAFICILSFVQDIIFNMEEVGMREEKTISITKSLKEVLTKFYNINKDSLATYQDITTNFNQIIALNASEKKVKSEDKESFSSAKSSGKIPSHKSSTFKKKKSSTVETIKEEDDVRSIGSKQFNEEKRNSNRYNNKNNNPNEKVNQSIGKTNTFEYFKKETPKAKKSNEEDIFINLEYKIKKDVSNENNKNTEDPINPIVIPWVEKSHPLFDSFNVNAKEPINFEGTSNIFLNNRNDANNNEGTNERIKSGKIKVEKTNEKTKEKIQEIENPLKIIDPDINKSEKIQAVEDNLSLDDKNEPVLRGKTPLEPKEKGIKLYKNNSNSSSLNNLLIVNNPPMTEHTANPKRNDISDESEDIQEKIILKASSHSHLPSNELRKNELVFGGNLSDKFKYFDLSNNEDFNELFKDDTGVNPDDMSGNQLKRKKKKNIFAEDEKYRDLKTTENFNFYSSNIFSKKAIYKK